MRIKQSALLLAAVLSLGVAAVPAAATQNGGSAPKEPVWEIPLDVQDAQGISPLDPAVNYYANIPEETYELAQEVAHFDGFATVNTFEWSDEDQTLKIHFHDGEDKLADFVDSLETKARAELVQDKYSSAELQAAADRIMRKGKLSTGEHISYISPKPDGSGIEVGIDMPADRIPERAARIRAELGVTVPSTIVHAPTPQAASRRVDSAPFWAGADMATDHETPGFINACTTGFAVGKYQSGQLVTEMITADHCGKAGDVWHTGRNLDNPVVGTSQSAWSGGSDIRRIIGQSYGPVVYVGDWQSTAATGVKGAVLPILNGYVCYTGSSSGIHCGNKIISLNDSVCYGAFHCYIGQTRTTQVDGISAAGQGDSGGPVIAVANGYAYAIGIISGMQNADKESCVGRTDGRLCSSELWFAPVAQFLSNNTEYGILVYGGTS